MIRNPHGFEDPLVKGKGGGPDSRTEPYEARVSRTVPLRRVWYHHLSGPTSGPRSCIPTHPVYAHRSFQEVGRLS